MGYMAISYKYWFRSLSQKIFFYTVSHQFGVSIKATQCLTKCPV